MREVHKYAVPVDGPFLLELPEGAEILTFDSQQVEAPKTAFVSTNQPQTAVGLFIWALVDPAVGHESRKFWITATGRPLPVPKVYHGTTQVGPYVFHLFEMPDTPLLHALGGEKIDLPS